MVFTSKPIYDNCIMAFMMELFCSRLKSCVISAQETTQKPQNRVLDSKCTICGEKTSYNLSSDSTCGIHT